MANDPLADALNSIKTHEMFSKQSCEVKPSKLVRETLKMMARQGVSIFMSTHSLPTAEELCDRVGFVKDGRLVFLGTQENLQAYKQKYDGKFESVFLELTK